MKILFVCLGNICRSPSAEAVMKAFVADAGLTSEIECDSAGTSAYHVGEKADARMRKHASQRGYQLTGRSRAFDDYADFEYFDWIVAMDDSNASDLRALDYKNKYAHKVVKMTDFCEKYEADHIPDPYYGGSEGFEEVLDLLEDACANLLKKIQSRQM